MARVGNPSAAGGWSQRSLPALALAVLVLVSALPAPFDQSLLPDLVLTGVYVVCVCRPAAVSPLLLFGLGLFHDLVGYTPVGLHALIYVLAYGLATRLPLDGTRLLPLWLGFVPVVAVTTLAGWLTVSVYHFVWLAPDPALARAAASILAFPLLGLPFALLLGERSDDP